MNITEMIPHNETPHNDLNSAYEEPLGVTRFLGKILVWVCFFLGLLLIGSCIWCPIHADMDAERRKQFESREMLRLFEETTQQQRQAVAEMRAAAEAAKGGTR